MKKRFFSLFLALMMVFSINTCTLNAYAATASTKTTVSKTTAKKKIPISKCKISSISAQTYTGKALKPKPKVTYGKKTLKYGTDYTLKYAANKNVGKATVTVTMKGSYTGSAKKAFTITPAINKTSAKLYRGTKLSLKVTSNAKVTYKTSDKTIATVSKTGVVTAVKKGTATITATSNGISVKCKVTVSVPTLSAATQKTVTVGKSFTYTVKGGSGTITYQSSNTKIATVNKDGKVTGKAPGSCTVSAKRNGVTVKCKVTVKAAAQPKTEDPKPEEPTEPSTLLAAPYRKIFATGCYEMTFQIEGNDQISDQDIKIAFKNQNIYMKINTEGLEIEVIFDSKSNTAKALIFPFYAELPMDEMGDIASQMSTGLLKDLPYSSVKVSKVKLNGKTLTKEAYQNTNGTISEFYFDGKTLVRHVMIDAQGQESVLNISSFSSTVNDSKFTVPFGYIKVDLDSFM